MIDSLSNLVHIDVALAIIVIFNIIMPSVLLWVISRVVFRHPLLFLHSLVLSIVFMMLSFVPSDKVVVNYYNMGDNRFDFYVRPFLICLVILAYDCIRYTRRLGSKNKKW